MDRDDDLEQMRWSSRSKPTKGPMRICKFCLFGILLPVILVMVPLYVRFQALKPHLFSISPSDMKLLNHESRVSTIWCQGQELRMNASFNAYLLSERPKLQRFRHHVTMHRKMILKDDIKEYWGFYLLKNSIVTLSVCSRHEGASFMVVKGLKDARRCAYLGELDSVEESDEISDEFEFEHAFKVFDDNEALDRIPEMIRPNRMGNRNTDTGNHDINQLRNLTKDQLLEKFLDIFNKIGQAKGSKEIIPFEAFQTSNANANRKEDSKDDDNTGREVVDEDEREPQEVEFAHHNEDVYHLIHQGEFDQRPPGGFDNESNEEVRSSWSSSEEALMACEGLIFNVPLNGGTGCKFNATDDQFNTVSTKVTLDVKETGFYYFIFANENEITDNFVSASFDMHKTVFNVSDSVRNCTNATKCDLPLQFWSKDHVVLELPESSVDPCDALTGFSSVEECHRVLLAESVCQPRKSLYMMCLLPIPLIVLMFAYI